jgi:hypothetical protein
VAAVENGLSVEYFLPEEDIVNFPRLLASHLDIRDGMIRLGGTPGHGIKFDPAGLAQSTVLDSSGSTDSMSVDKRRRCLTSMAGRSGQRRGDLRQHPDRPRGRRLGRPRRPPIQRDESVPDAGHQHILRAQDASVSDSLLLNLVTPHQPIPSRAPKATAELMSP